MTKRIEHTDVLVIGAGVTGLAATMLLHEQGVRSLTIAKHPGPAPQPRAHITNQRTIEIFRDLDMEEEVTEAGTPLQSVDNTVFATSFAGPELVRLRSYGSGPRLSDYLEGSPCPPLNVPQHVLEPIMLGGARSRGADVRFNHEMTALEQTEDEVVAQVRNRESGEVYEIRAQYAIGADGGRSQVAESNGISFAGEGSLMHMVNAWLEVDLERFTANRPGVIYAMMQPGVDSWVGSGSFVMVRPWKEWVLVRQYDPSAGDPDLSDEAVTAAVRALVGDPDIEVKVKGTSKWQVNNMVAERYRSGRVFLAGDAAHRHNPSGGLGTNTSIQDAYNLAWKLAFVVKGHARPGLLNSYHDERHPVGEQVLDRAMRSLQSMGKIAAALGIRPGQTAEEGWAALEELASDADGAEERRADLSRAVGLLNYRSNAQGVELGQRYVSDAVVGDGTPFPVSERDPELYYEPTTHPGAYLPHAWVERHRERVSTLDLAGHGRFCLIVGVGGEPWKGAAREVAAELGIELPVFAVGYRCEYDDVLAQWARVREIDDRGALLVRPDRHVAWRSMSRPASPREALASALRTILDRGVGAHQSSTDGHVTAR